jgi:hypothetical protein
VAQQNENTTPAQSKDGSDPTVPYTEYRLEAAAVTKGSGLYAVDTAKVSVYYSQLGEVQNNYAQAKKAQKSAYEELSAQLGRIRNALHCLVSPEDREALTECWKKLVDETSAAVPDLDCSPIDSQQCDDLPNDAETLKSVISDAKDCTTRADTFFENLVLVPERLGPRVNDLKSVAAALEQATGAPDTDPKRQFVEYLQLRADFKKLEDDWIEPISYASKAKHYFTVLLHRHRLTICLETALARETQRSIFEQESAAQKKTNLVDLVLECVGPDQGPVTGETQTDSELSPADSAKAPATATAESEAGDMTSSSAPVAETAPHKAAPENQEPERTVLSVDAQKQARTTPRIPGWNDI